MFALTKILVPTLGVVATTGTGGNSADAVEDGVDVVSSILVHIRNVEGRSLARQCWVWKLL